MRLSLLKCAFKVGLGKFLRFTMNQRGIESNLKKIQALLDMKFTQKPQQIQILIGRIVVPSHFISWDTYRCLLFFEALKELKNFECTKKCKQAFQELRRYVGQPILLSKPIKGNTLYVYLVISQHAISAILIREEEKSNGQCIMWTIDSWMHKLDIEIWKI